MVLIFFRLNCIVVATTGTKSILKPNADLPWIKQTKKQKFGENLFDFRIEMCILCVVLKKRQPNSKYNMRKL